MGIALAKYWQSATFLNLGMTAPSMPLRESPEELIFLQVCQSINGSMCSRSVSVFAF
ncbi:MAG: hypothetical protein ACKVHP_08485 [Verrucomicrobiales bacterium]